MSNELELVYEGKLIYIVYFDTEKELQEDLSKDGIEVGDDVIGYCNTFTEGDWGRIYLTKNPSLNTVIHEAVHLAGGIMARKGVDTLEMTAHDAGDNEEKFCGLVGEVAGLILETDPEPPISADTEGQT